MEKCPSQYGVPTIRPPKRSLHPRGVVLVESQRASAWRTPRLDMSLGRYK